MVSTEVDLIFLAGQSLFRCKLRNLGVKYLFYLTLVCLPVCKAGNILQIFPCCLQTNGTAKIKLILEYRTHYDTFKVRVVLIIYSDQVYYKSFVCVTFFMFRYTP